MSAKELERLHWMRQLMERRATQREAAEALGLAVRQVQRLRDAFVERGAGWLRLAAASSANRAHANELRDHVLDAVRTRY